MPRKPVYALALLSACAPGRGEVDVTGMATDFGRMKSVTYQEGGPIEWYEYVTDGSVFTGPLGAYVDSALRLSSAADGCGDVSRTLERWMDRSQDFLDATNDGTDDGELCDAVTKFLRAEARSPRYDGDGARERVYIGLRCGFEGCEAEEATYDINDLTATVSYYFDFGDDRIDVWDEDACAFTGGTGLDVQRARIVEGLMDVEVADGDALVGTFYGNLLDLSDNQQIGTVDGSFHAKWCDPAPTGPILFIR